MFKRGGAASSGRPPVRIRRSYIIALHSEISYSGIFLEDSKSNLLATPPRAGRRARGHLRSGPTACSLKPFEVYLNNKLVQKKMVVWLNDMLELYSNVGSNGAGRRARAASGPLSEILYHSLTFGNLIFGDICGYIYIAYIYVHIYIYIYI